MNECCGNCKHCEQIDTPDDIPCDFMCGNKKSNEYGSPVPLDGSCSEFTKKK